MLVNVSNFSAPHVAQNYDKIKDNDSKKQLLDANLLNYFISNWGS